MSRLAPVVEHLYRRAGFGLSPLERGGLASAGAGPGARVRDLVDGMLVYDPATSVDHLAGTPGYVGITATTQFSPSRDINHARQGWLFRMVHSPAPLRERMAMLWHHHFATAYTKIAGLYGPVNGTRLMAGRPADDPARQRGQIELFRDMALGRFSDLLVAVAKDPAMLIWLDGQTNVKARPQENFGRELMELFTFGIGPFTEADVYAAARVFTGWNLRINGAVASETAAFEFIYNAAQHDVDAKVFTFPTYSSRGRVNPYRIEPRPASAGMQDGLDLIHALAYHPETARRIARRLWTWFVSEVEEPSDRFVESIARVYLDTDTSMRAVMRAVLLSAEFQDEAHFFKRYAWPVEFVVRSLKEVGHVGFSVADSLTPLLNMGQQLFEPPDVNGWALGSSWFSTGGTLARMNFASQLATNQRFALRDRARPSNASPETLIEFARANLSLGDPVPSVSDTLIQYVRSGGTWTGSDAQLLTKTAGLFHLLTGSGEYQLT
jgi:uncharacterized protein (DUF1800 family)